MKYEKSTQTDTMTRLDQTRMPFLESLVVEKASRQTSFHMPGHKGTLAPDPVFMDYVGGNPHPADLVEINGIIDYLHSPKGALMQAQNLAAQAYGADHTFFLINGSTVGNVGAIMAASSDGQKVIMPRASHRSVYGGVVLSGATPVYIEPIYHPLVGFPVGVRNDVVAQLLAAHDNVAAVHVTAPNYYGIQCDVASIAALAHQHGALMLVDEAHGSHLGFHDGLPTTATRAGADMIIQSTHKTQGALTQASMLHCNDGGVNLARVGQVLALLQSSSPSSILLASLDAARMQMATQGAALLSRVIELSAEARTRICQIDGLWCYGDEIVGEYGIFAYDPTKLVIRVADLGLSGFDVSMRLRHSYGIDVEFADLRQIICSVTIGDTQASIELLLNSLQAIAAEKLPYRQELNLKAPDGLPEMAMVPRDAYFARSRAVPILEAIGEVCAENIIPYPPGIPLVVPGEIITAEILDYLAELRRMGSGVVGPEDQSLVQIRIVE